MTNSRHAHPIAPNSCAASRSPDTAWPGDITYIPTGEGPLTALRRERPCTKRRSSATLLRPCIDTNLTSPPPAWGALAPRLCPASSSTRPRRPNTPPTLTVSVSPARHPARHGPGQGSCDNAAVGRKLSAAVSASAVHSSRHFRLAAHAMADVFAYIETFTTQCARIPLLAGVPGCLARALVLSIPPPEDTTRYPAFLSFFILPSTKPEGHTAKCHAILFILYPCYPVLLRSPQIDHRSHPAYVQVWIIAHQRLFSSSRYKRSTNGLV